MLVVSSNCTLIAAVPLNEVILSTSTLCLTHYLGGQNRQLQWWIAGFRRARRCCTTFPTMFASNWQPNRVLLRVAVVLPCPLPGILHYRSHVAYIRCRWILASCFTTGGALPTYFTCQFGPHWLFCTYFFVVGLCTNRRAEEIFNIASHGLGIPFAVLAVSVLLDVSRTTSHVWDLQHSFFE